MDESRTVTAVVNHVGPAIVHPDRSALLQLNVTVDGEEGEAVYLLEVAPSLLEDLVMAITLPSVTRGAHLED